MDHKIKPMKDKLFSFSLTLLAASIAYFAYSILSVSQQIPSILDQVSDINHQIDRTAEKVEPLLVLVPDILQTVENTTNSIPPILDEVGKVRQLVPVALKEVEAVRLTLPSILERVDKLHAQIDILEKRLPDILKTVNQITVVVNDTNQQIEKALPLVPEILGEVEKTRNEIPSYLTRVETIVDNTKDISETAGKGAVTGFFKGIISTPFELLKGTENKIRSSLKNEDKITEEDFTLVYQATAKLLQSDKKDIAYWDNSKTGNKGQVKLVNSFKSEGRECRTVQLLFKAHDGNDDSVNRDFCLNDEGKWGPVE